jgi:hypothetical protein
MTIRYHAGGSGFSETIGDRPRLILPIMAVMLNNNLSLYFDILMLS